MSLNIRRFLFNHIALPPALPNKEEEDIRSLERKLLSSILKSAKEFNHYLPPDALQAWSSVVKTLGATLSIQRDEGLSSKELKDVLLSLQPAQTVVLFIVSQNAGLLINRVNEQDVVFEAFEASPKAAPTLAAEGPLICKFPSSAAQIPVGLLQEDDFLSALTSMIEKMSIEAIPRFAATTAKGASFAREIRDVTSPTLVVNMLITMLEAQGSATTMQIVKKHIRDDVCWSDGSRAPWRRSPMWLVVRVGLQKYLYRIFGPEHGHAYYKCFVAFVHVQLFEELMTEVSFPTENIQYMRAKIGRRLQKLQDMTLSQSRSTVSTTKQLLGTCSPYFEKILTMSNLRLENTWAETRRRLTRTVPRLDYRAPDESLTLLLSNSLPILRQILAEDFPNDTETLLNLSGKPRPDFQRSDIPTIQRRDGLSRLDRLLYLADIEEWVELHLSEFVAEPDSPVSLCGQLYQFLHDYIGLALPEYSKDAERNSIMLLTVFEVWVALDNIVISLVPLLKKFSPALPSDLLDTLQLPFRKDMKRKFGIEEKLRSRNEECEYKHLSIFGDVTPLCFAVKYFDQAPPMQEALDTIHAVGRSQKAAKEREWAEKSKKHTELLQQIAEMSCLFTDDQVNPLLRQHDEQRCKKCFLMRESRRVRIQPQEYLLPEEDFIAKAVVFELLCPTAFAIWRDTTWMLLCRLCRPPPGVTRPAITTVREYGPLQGWKRGTSLNVSLGSQTKPFTETHYYDIKYPVDLKEVLLPNGMRLKYYDAQSRLWTSTQTTKPNLANHTLRILPSDSRYSFINELPAFQPGQPGRTHNQIISTQSTCPNTLSVNEYMAHQDIRSGWESRWLRLLREIGSSNVPLNNEAILISICQVACEVGPQGSEINLGTLHWMFRDITFCKCLLQQLKARLTSVAANWRESHLMEIIIVLGLRVVELSDDTSIKFEACDLLEQARSTTVNWIRALRLEVYNATSADVSKKRSEDTFWAAILCRKTFALLAEQQTEIAGSDTELLIESSIALHENSPKAKDQSPRQVRALAHDVGIIHNIEQRFRVALVVHQKSIARAINKVWPSELHNASRDFDTWKQQPSPGDQWLMTNTLPREGLRRQKVAYNFFKGSLYVDGRPLGKLPEEHHRQPLFRRMFEDRAFLTFPSDIPGMVYRFASLVQGHSVHLGFRGQTQVIKLAKARTVYEVIPEESFRGRGGICASDIPIPLINDHVHLLNARERKLEIRPRASMWIPTDKDWIIDLTSNRARLRQGTNSTYLVEPTSGAFEIIAQVIVPFELRTHMIVSQPEKSGLTVALPRYDLSFAVNKSGWLRCRQLNNTVVDRNQDIGTLFGLQGKIVLRNQNESTKRDVLVPMSLPIIKRDGGHVSVVLPPAPFFCKFTVRHELGRLDCSVEPRFIYQKALCHASTSSILPDPLTGRTGVEEALACLSESHALPYQPLHERELSILRFIAGLTPKREYYPLEMKVMQKIYWEPELPGYLQHDLYFTLIQSIVQRSEKLRPFFMNLPLSEPSLPEKGDNHLQLRALARHSNFRPPSPSANLSYKQNGRIYRPFQSDHNQQLNSNVFEIVSTTLSWPKSLAIDLNLLSTFESWNIITGFAHSFDKVMLNDILNLDFASSWCPLVDLICTAQQSLTKQQLVFTFSLIAFSRNADLGLIKTLLAFCLFEDMRNLPRPPWDQYKNFRHGQNPHLAYLKQLMARCRVAYPGDERTSCPIGLTLKRRRELEAEEADFERRTSNDAEMVASHFHDQWPCLKPSFETESETVLINFERVKEIVLPEWASMFQNRELSTYLRDLQGVLDKHHSNRDEICKYQPQQEVSYYDDFSEHILRDSLSALFMEASDILDPVSSLEFYPTQKMSEHPSMGSLTDTPHSSESGAVRELRNLIQAVHAVGDSIRRRYAEDLQSSLDTYIQAKPATSMAIAPTKNHILARKSQARQRMQHCLESLQSLSQSLPAYKWSNLSGIAPRLTPTSLLKCLSSRSRVYIPRNIKDKIVGYADATVEYQKWARIETAALGNSQNRTVLMDELSNPGHAHWDIFQNTDWLLLEVESNLQIRPNQVDVANAIIKPTTGRNSVLQMMMGQGKSSCIIPMVAAKLADGQRLLRVVVPRSLLFQTAQVLQARLGGLLERSIIHVPFSRRTPTSKASIRSYSELHQDCMQDQGVVLTLPEHILSFMLSGKQLLLDNNIEEAKPMLRTQEWLSNVSRDVLDECDVSLSVKTQLIFPSGTQRMVEGHPGRWKVAEAVLHLTKHHIKSIQETLPRGVEVRHSHGDSFPSIFFLQKAAEDKLVLSIISSLLQGYGSILPVEFCSSKDLEAVHKFLREPRFDPDEANAIMKKLRHKPSVWQDVLILRGLLIHRILLMALQKRWNVQYGLHPRRDPIAVPFHAKGIPSEQSEWGHPDVAILLTCLSFYYEGLSLGQLQRSIEQLLRSDNPALEYDRWIENARHVPLSLRDWTSINVDDDVQCHHLWTHLRYNMVVVDYYLNSFVFPRHAKQFNRKLQASGWDIPLQLKNARGRSHQVEKTTSSPAVQGKGKPLVPLTTGFSGTNDSRLMLPMNIQQVDLSQLSGTNAEVLQYLLQDRNRFCRRMTTFGGKRQTEIEFLESLKAFKSPNPPHAPLAPQGIKILIDAGAQILELSNLEVAKAWLKIEKFAPAAVYFDDGDKPWICHKDDKIQPLFSSPFADDLSECLVYLDEAHTRGTDLKFPPQAVGALTLGLGQTKDHTVQAAMRLRQLGTTQSVVFFTPPEVHQSICDHTGKKRSDYLYSKDVISWLVEQTCKGIEQLQPLYVSQGEDFCARSQAHVDSPDHAVDEAHRRAYLKAIETREQLSLEDLYAPKRKTRPIDRRALTVIHLRKFSHELALLRKNFHDHGLAVHGSALQEVEQEREVQVEVEAVRQVQIEKPAPAKALPHLALHEDLAHLADTGTLRRFSMYFEQLFGSWNKTALGRKYSIDQEASSKMLYVTPDFSKTVVLKLGANDSYARPVQWVLWGCRSKAAVIISPDEAEKLIPRLRRAGPGRCHMLVYAAPVTRRMLHFDDLRYYSVPPLPEGWKAPEWLTHELGLFAGRLYFQYETYDGLRPYLGLKPKLDVDSLSMESAEPANPDEETPGGRFTAHPLAFMEDWLTIRRKGQDFIYTPMGLICQGKRLRKDGAFESGQEGRIEELEENGKDNSEGAHDDPDSDIDDYDEVNYADEMDIDGDTLQWESEDASSSDESTGIRIVQDGMAALAIGGENTNILAQRSGNVHGQATEKPGLGDGNARVPDTSENQNPSTK